MAYKIEFEDHQQDLLWLICDEESGEILDAGPFHKRLYASGAYFVDVGQLLTNQFVWFAGEDGARRYFKWPMFRLSRDGVILASVQIH